MKKSASVFQKKRGWLLLLLGLILLFPFETTVVPPRNVLVVTNDWRPIQGIRVRQIWQDYSLETEGREEDKGTDENGRLSFPRRTIKANLLWRIVRPVFNITSQGVHASFGVQTDMFTVDNFEEKPAAEKKVERLPGDIVFRPK